MLQGWERHRESKDCLLELRHTAYWGFRTSQASNQKEYLIEIECHLTKNGHIYVISMKKDVTLEMSMYRVSDNVWRALNQELKALQRLCACAYVTQPVQQFDWSVTYRDNHLISCFHSCVDQMPLFCVVVRSKLQYQPVKRYFLFFSGWTSKKIVT